MRGKGFWTSLRLYFSLVVIGLFMVILGWSDFWCSLSQPIDLNTCDISEIKKGAHVKMSVGMVMDYYANEATETKTYGVTTDVKEDTSRYYILPIDRYDEATQSETEHYITVKVSAKNYEAYEGIAEQTWQIWWNEYDYSQDYLTIPLEGKIISQKSDLKGWMSEYFAHPDIQPYIENGWFAPENCMPLVIVPITPTVSYIIVIIGGILVLIGAALVILQTRNGNKKTSMDTPYGGNNYGTGYNYGGDQYQSNTDTYGDTASEQPNIPKPNYGVGEKIFINGNSYKRTELEPINQMIVDCRMEEAREALLKLDGIDEYAVDQIVNNWNVFYS